MADRRLSITVDGASKVSALHSEPSGQQRARWTFIYAAGASANLDDPFGVYAARALPEQGVAVVRFQFPYAEAGRRSPDRPPVLEATWRAVMDAVRAGAGRLVVGGRSMGGRIASQVVAADTPADALALFAYPLHPPGKPDQMRDAHFGDLRLPVLFCSGTNDAFASPDELSALTKRVRGAKLHLLQGADHGFAVRKSSGRTREDVWSEAIDAMLKWLAASA